jgi:rare lipoprotein A
MKETFTTTNVSSPERSSRPVKRVRCGCASGLDNIGFGFVLVIAAMLLASSCGGKKVKVAKTPRMGSKESGIASWYGYPYHGRRAANGEIYDMEKLTAAHRTLPFDTWVRVRNLTNNKTVDVRIQDRGPFVNDRIIDLSKAAARQIEMIGPGIAKVTLTIIAPPPVKEIEKEPELFAVQVGAFRERTRAESVRDAMKSAYGQARIVERTLDGTIYRVLVGAEDTEDKATALAERIRATGSPGFVVRLDVVQP